MNKPEKPVLPLQRSRTEEQANNYYQDEIHERGTEERDNTAQICKVFVGI